MISPLFWHRRTGAKFLRGGGGGGLSFFGVLPENRAKKDFFSEILTGGGGGWRTRKTTKVINMRFHFNLRYSSNHCPLSCIAT